MIRGGILLVPAVLLVSAGLLGAETPDSAIMATWQAVMDGSPSGFLATLHPDCSAEILQLCQRYLDMLRKMSPQELGEVFALHRLEAAPDEVELWDSSAVLEMFISSPAQLRTLESSNLLIDSLQEEDSISTVFLSLSLPDGIVRQLEVEVVSTPLGQRVSGLEPYFEELLRSSLPR